MATKPTTTVPQWAATTLYTIGVPVDIGTPTKVDSTTVAPEGHVPGLTNPTAGQNMNDWQFKVSQDCQWVEAGSSLGAADAHIVEANSAGKTTLQALDILGTTPVAGPALHVKFGSLGSEVALFEHGDANAAVVSVGGPTADQYGVWAQAISRPAIRATAIGFQPIELGVQIVTIPAPGANSGAIWFPREGTVTDFRVANGGRTHVVSYETQFVRIVGTSPSVLVLSAVSPSYEALSGLNALPPSNEVISPMSLVATISFNATTNGNPSQELTVRLSNGGSPIFSTMVHMDAGIEDVKIVKQYFSVSPGPQSFQVFINKSNGGGSISISNFMFEIQTLI